jgi:hypothetical protein
MPDLRRHPALLLLALLPTLACPGGGGDGGDEQGDSSDASSSGTAEGSGSESASSGSETATTSETTAETSSGESTLSETSSETATTADTSTDTSTDTTTGGGELGCASDAECVLVNDCCHCTAAPLDAIPDCDLPECFALVCDSTLGQIQPTAECRVGTCQLGQVSCDLNQVQCDIPEPPACEGGLVRAVVGGCYGPCVPPSMCEALPFECDAATCGEGYACMTTQSGAPSQCVPLPPECGGVASCECISPYLDEVCNASCGDGGGGTLICEDGG